MTQNGLHLNKADKIYLANTFISFINRYILHNKEACNDSDNCLSNAFQENWAYPKENKFVKVVFRNKF